MAYTLRYSTAYFETPGSDIHSILSAPNANHVKYQARHCRPDRVALPSFSRSMCKWFESLFRDLLRPPPAPNRRNPNKSSTLSPIFCVTTDPALNNEAIVVEIKCIRCVI